MGLTLVTLAMALAFCAVHIFVGKLRFLERRPRSAWLSFAGGVAVGYVFLHILPELAAHGDVFADATGLAGHLAQAWIYTLALAGLALFYGLERAIAVSREDAREGGSSERPGHSVFWLHCAVSSALVFVIAYLLNHREDTTVAGLALYFGAMVLHFTTADFGARADHPEVYDARGRWILAAATLGGWITGLLIDLPDIAIGCLFAFVGGAIILVVLKEELPEEEQSRFLPFLAGSALYAVLVLAEQSARTG